MLYQRSSQLFAEAEKVIPGGVNSPVRAFRAVGGIPIFVKSAKGAYLYDEDGNRLIDYIGTSVYNIFHDYTRYQKQIQTNRLCFIT